MALEVVGKKYFVTAIGKETVTPCFLCLGIFLTLKNLWSG